MAGRVAQHHLAACGLREMDTNWEREQKQLLLLKSSKFDCGYCRVATFFLSIYFLLVWFVKCLKKRRRKKNLSHMLSSLR